MKDTTWESILQRLMEASNSPNETILSTRLGLSAQAVYNARKKQQIPPAWVFEISKTFGVSADWLFFGRGPMRPIWEEKENPSVNGPQSMPISQARCPRCAKLEERLELLENERRVVSAENRQLHKEIAALLRELGDLREKAAHLQSSRGAVS